MKTTTRIDPAGTVIQNIPPMEGSETISADVHHFHYGIMLNQHTPTTGVYGGNQLDWECMPYEYIDLDVETWTQESAEEHGEDTDAYDQAVEFMESGETLLYGSWEKVDGQYQANKDADDPEDFAAIYNANENTLQVIWSKVIGFGKLASPCYPGQVSANPDDPDTAQEDYIQAYFALPSDCLYTEAKYQESLRMIAYYKQKMADQEAIDKADDEIAAKGLSEV